MITNILIWLLFGIVITWLFELTLKTNKALRRRYYTRHAIIWGYHIHHSTYGLLCFLIGMFLFFDGRPVITLPVIAFGLGIIIMHTISDPRHRVVFIEKE